MELKKVDPKKYLIENCDFSDGMKGVSFTYRDSLNTSLALIYADGVHIGTIALSNEKEEDLSSCEIAFTEGIKNVEIKIDGDVNLLDVKFLKTSPYENVNYEPILDSQIADTLPDTWEATDMLGRKIPSVEDVGAKKSEKKVGLFYWTWRDKHARTLRPVNVTKLLEEYPAAEYNREHPGWSGYDIQPHWNEPLYGFYRNSDRYVLRHHASMLAAAGVDFLLFDCTNVAFVWKDGYQPLLEEFYRAKKDGINVPKIAFMMNFWAMSETEKMLRFIYQDFYKSGKYSDLWFRIGDKPMVMAYKESLREKGDSDFDTALLDEIRNFFEFRAGQPFYGRENGGQKRNDHWGWLEIYPQNKYGVKKDGSCEMMTVGVGQNANDEMICTYFNNKNTYGRSYTKAHGHSLLSKDSYKYGYNVQEQWDRALDISPEHIFVTGWNEWMMGLFKEPWVKDPDSTQLAMVDQYDREHSRDIEPDIDGYLDTYYLQLAANIRRFKGAVQRPETSGEINIEKISDFDSVKPYYKADKGMTIHRNCDGFVGCHYENYTGRNDIIGSKVARNNEYVWFMAECTENISEPQNKNWMTLYIDCDRNKESGWEGYDIVVNRLFENGKAVIEKYVKTADKNSYTWERIGDTDVIVEGTKLYFKIPRALISAGHLNFEFKWNDNMQKSDVMDFYVNGCTAPLGRFNYLYKE